ncbi:MAG: B12-binding domain-containing radical SAM protein [Thermoleophilia bacterium]
MRVLFVYPNVARNRSPQVGLSSLAGTLRREGHEYRLFDITFLKDSEIADAYCQAIIDFKPDVIGVSCRSTEWETARSIIRMSDASVPVIFGGPHATIDPEQVIADGAVDMLVRGEGEGAIVDVLEGLEAGADLGSVANLWLKRDNGEIVRNELRDLTADLDTLAMPEWDLWDQRHFQEHYHQVFYPAAKIFGDLETSRGCPYACPYCLTPVLQKLYKGKGKYHREKSPQRVVAEVRKLMRERDIDYVRFVDETFIMNHKRIHELCRLYEDEVGLPFSFSTRPETVKEDTMTQLAKAGANCVSFGLESGNENYRREMLNRKTKQQEIIDAVRICKQFGVKTFAFVMIGLPREDRGKIQDTLELINLLQPDVFQITIFYPFQGTPFYRYCVDEGLLDPDHEPLTEIWKGSVLKQPQFTSEYLVRLRQLMLIFAKRDRRWWPLMKHLEDHPGSFSMFMKLLRARALFRRLVRTGAVTKMDDNRKMARQVVPVDDRPPDEPGATAVDADAPVAANARVDVKVEQP